MLRAKLSVNQILRFYITRQRAPKFTNQSRIADTRIYFTVFKLVECHYIWGRQCLPRIPCRH